MFPLPYCDLKSFHSGLPAEDVPLPAGYFIHPDESEEAAIQGPARDKILDMWEELSACSLKGEDIDKKRSTTSRI